MMYLDIEAQAALGAMRRAELRRELIDAQLARQARQARRQAEGSGDTWASLAWLRAAVGIVRLPGRANRPAI